MCIETEALRAAFYACKARADASGLSEEKFISGFVGWEIIPVVVGGNIVGSVMLNGPEMHVAVSEFVRRKWATPALWRKVIDKTLDQYGFAVTSAMEGNAQGLEFVKRIGFVEISRHGGVIVFRLDKK